MKPDSSPRALKSANVGFRLDAATYAELERFEQISGLEKVSLIRAALGSALEFWTTHGFLSFPLKVVPVSDHGMSDGD